MGRGLFAWLALWVATSTARADVFVIPPPIYEAATTNGAQVGAALVALAQEELAVGARVIGPAEAVKFMPADQRTWCGASDCMERYRVATKATAAVAIRIYRLSEGAGPATSFQIAMQPAPGLEYEHGVVISDSTPLSEQVRLAVRELIRKYRRGPGPHLSVTGAPRGAFVYIDDEPRGALPAFVTVSAGPHRVRVEATGFTPRTRFVSLQSATSYEELDVRLEPETRSASAAQALDATHGDRDARLSGRARWGVALMVSGAAVASTGLVYALASALQHGDRACARTDGPYCAIYTTEQNRTARIATGSAVAALGVGTLVTGAVLFRREKNRTRVGVSGSPTRALVMVGRSF